MPEVIEGLILSSTTDTQEQVDEAAGIKPTEEPPATEVEVETPAESGTAEEAETQKPKAKGGFQKRIDRLTKSLREEQSKREELEKRLAEKPAAAASKEETPKPDERPKLADFNGDADKWFDARVEWDKKQAAKQAEEEERREVFDTYEVRKAEAAERHEDWEEIKAELEAGNYPISFPATNAIIESEIGPEIAYYLAKNPEELERINDITSALSVAREIGKIEAKLSAQTSESPKKVIRTNAPKPITPVGGSTKRTVSIDDPNVSTEDYYEARKAMRRGR